MASFNDPKLSNHIADDVPAIRQLLRSVATLDPATGNTDIPNGAKRLVETAQGYEFQSYNGTAWVTLEKWNLDVQKVDGYSASTGTTASTIPVRDANGKLPGDITGNAASADEAKALSETNPIAAGGTGATTAEQARANLVVPPKSHASSSSEFGAGSSTQYGHLKSHDEPDATLTAATGHAFSPAGAASLKTELEEQIEEVGAGASSQLSSLDSSLRALIAQEVAKCLKTSGGTMTGNLLLGFGAQIVKEDNNSELLLCGGTSWQGGSFIAAHGKEHAGAEGCLDLKAMRDGYATCQLFLQPGEMPLANGSPILTSAGGTMTGSLLVSNILSGGNNGFGLYGGNAWRTGAYIELSGPNSNHVQIAGGSRQLLEDLGAGWHIAGAPVLTLVASWGDGAGNWYRKYSDGFIMQAGRTSKRPPIGESKWAYQADFHIPFATTQYIVEHGATSFSNDASGAHATENIATTYCYIYEATYIRSGEARWFACGY